MSKHHEPSDGSRGRVELKVGESYWVQCDGYRTMAVFLGDKKWRSLIYNEEIFDVIFAE